MVMGYTFDNLIILRGYVRDFPRPVLGIKYRPLPNSKMSKNFQKMVYIIPNFLVIHCGENFMKIWTKLVKLQMHEKLHKNVNENMFSFTFL